MKKTGAAQETSESLTGEFKGLMHEANIAIFNQAHKIDDVAIKIDQVKTLMEILIRCNDEIPPECRDNIIHVAFDILDDQENELIMAAAALLDQENRRTGEQKENKTLQTV